MPHTLIARAAAVLLALCACLAVASPAQAASYRDLKSVRHNLCFYAYGDPLEDLFLKNCNTKPVRYGNWAVTRVGYYNNHPLWVLKRQKGSCLGVLGMASSRPYLYSSCDPKGSANVWEVFTTKYGKKVLKSFGAYQSGGKHLCLTFDGHQNRRPQLGACSLTSTAGQIYK